MSTYKAWDGNDYPLPTPDGWYQGSDQLWWPEGYGPGPAVAPAPEPAPSPAAPPMPTYEAPLAESPAFDSDPTTVLPTSPAPTVGGTIPGHAMPAPGAFDPVSTGSSPPPAVDQWSQPPGAAPGGFEAPPAHSADWSQPPGGEAPGSASASSGSSSSKLPLIAGAALLALVVIGGLAFVFTRSDSGGEVVAFDPTAVKGSAANPHTPGDLVRISYDSDAGDRVEWAIEVPDPPVDSSSDAGDEADATVQLRVSLNEAAAAESLSVLSFKAVSTDGARTSVGGCGTLSSPLATDRLVSVGETTEGQVCWQVPAGDLGTIMMMVEVDGIDGAVYMELQ